MYYLDTMPGSLTSRSIHINVHPSLQANKYRCARHHVLLLALAPFEFGSATLCTAEFIPTGRITLLFG